MSNSKVSDFKKKTKSKKAVPEVVLDSEEETHHTDVEVEVSHHTDDEKGSPPVVGGSDEEEEEKTLTDSFDLMVSSITDLAKNLKDLAAFTKILQKQVKQLEKKGGKRKKRKSGDAAKSTAKSLMKEYDVSGTALGKFLKCDRITRNDARKRIFDYRKEAVEKGDIVEVPLEKSIILVDKTLGKVFPGVSKHSEYILNVLKEATESSEDFKEQREFFRNKLKEDEFDRHQLLTTNTILTHFKNLYFTPEKVITE